MKLDRIIWGVLLLFIGGVLLLDNFDVIDFHWWNVLSFFPIFIIILGINMLFSRNNSQTGNIISLGVLVIALGFLFVKGQEEPTHKSWWWNKSWRYSKNDNEKYTTSHFTAPFLAGDANRKTILNISGGATAFELKGATDSLFTADVRRRTGGFELIKSSSDSVNTLNFRMQEKKNGSWSFGDGNDAEIYLNTNPIWEMNVKMGAGAINFDLSNYKVRTFNFEGGVARLEAKIGSLLPITDINVETGITHVTIEIPEGSGCRIKSKTGLSKRDFERFTKIDENTYETPNYNSSTNKIFINFEGGFTSFEVKKY